MRLSHPFEFVTAFWLIFLAGRAQALELGWGLAAGMGGHQYQAAAHPAQADPGNLFSILAGQVTVTAEAGLGGGLGFEGHLGWARVVELRAEAWWVLRSAKVSEDLGDGFVRSTNFVREAAESAALIRLGYPFSAGAKSSFRPLLEGGVFGNRTLNSRREIGLKGGGNALSRPWDGLPNEDWGWAAGFSLEYLAAAAKGPKAGITVTPSLGVRYYEGQKDLDPKGPNELKSRSWMILLTLGF